MDLESKKLKGFVFVLLLLSVFLLSLYKLGNVAQSSFNEVFLFYTIAFGAFVCLIKWSEYLKTIGPIVIGGIIGRLLFLFLFPNLSDDIYRFMWDGHLSQLGIHPFSYTPEQIMELDLADDKLKSLFPLLNSQGYYSIYPPVCQGLFSMSMLPIWPEWMQGNLVLKLVFFLAELMSCLGLYLIIKSLTIAPHKLGLYMLNPLIIVELMGNLHFEAIMICFVVWMLYFLLKSRFLMSGLLYGLAIATKLTPFIIGPLILSSLKLKDSFKLLIVGGVILVSLFAVMIYPEFSGLLESVDLYFRSFEYNASLYYILRWLGQLVTGYNQIAIIGPGLAIFSVVSILYLAFKGNSIKSGFATRKFATYCLLIFSFYLVCSTTVHPWYIAPLVMFAVLTDYKFPIVWSYLIILSYSGYQYAIVEESSVLLVIEYGIVLLVFLYEWRQKKTLAPEH